MAGAVLAEQGSLSLELTPDQISLDLFPKIDDQLLDRFSTLWHSPEDEKRTQVTVTSTSSDSSTIVLSVSGLRPGWFRWLLIQRKPREFEGGEALNEQDEVSGGELRVLLLPGETRTFSLLMNVALDAGTVCKSYPFTIVASGSMETATTDGILELRHPDGEFLNRLPNLYGEEMRKERSESDNEVPFFERFLLGFEDSLRPLQATLARLDQLFGSFSAPSEYLVWLAAWVSAPVDDNWPEMRRRALIREAVELFRWRGTKRGLSRYLEIYTGVKPQIDDQPVEGMRLGSSTRLGDEGTVLGDIPPHTFVVTIASPNLESLNEQVLHDIITFEKPAHTAYALRLVRRTS